MKKLLGVSIVAMLAVMPMMAHAAGETPSQADANSTPYIGVTVADSDKANIASTAYVKGAYNAAIGAVDAVSAAKQDKLMAGANAVSSTVKTTVGAATGTDSASDTALVTEKAVRDAIDAVNSANTTSAGAGISKSDSGVIAVDMTQNGGLQMTGTGDSATLGVKVNTATMNLDSNGIGIKNAGVDSAQLADSAVISAKIADSAVTTDKIADSNVTDAKLASNAVTTAKILDSNVTTGKLADSAVTTAKILDSNVTTGKLADGAVTTAKIDAGAVTNEKLASNAVQSGNIVDSAVTNTKIADNAVTYAKLDSNLVQSSVRSLASGDSGFEAWESGQTVASEKAVATAISTATNDMATRTGVVATVNSAVIKLYDKWGDTTTTNAAAGTISVAAYQSSAS